MLSGYRKPFRTALFISGGGSTLQALLELQHLIDITLVVSNKKTARGLKKAQRFGRPVISFESKIDFAQIDKILKQHKIEKIFLVGFMKILPEDFVVRWAGRILNIHPSLLPVYPGLSAAEKSWKDRVQMGATVHLVTAQIDAGEIIDQQVSLPEVNESTSWEEAHLFLRRTEQSLLREVALRHL